MEQEPVLCFFVTAAKDFFFMIYVVESYVCYHLLIVLSMENGRAVLIRHSQTCQPWKTSSYTISQMCDKECHSIQNNGQRRSLVTAVFLVPLP